MTSATKRVRHRRIYVRRWQAVRLEALARDNRACCRCGGTHRLAVHHVDHDGPDYELENLETLCAACHAREHKPWRVVAAKTHCKHGHAFTPENTVRSTNGYRCCLVCKRESLRRWRRQRRALAEGVV